ncbi:MAG TPA: TonB-dependent receptor [Bryobacteraceae bacterium]|nr:TonB-dependent receptor [Bryobacteraceae bacterium]
MQRLLPILLFFQAILASQTGDSTQILGSVEDPTGASVGGVAITATHLSTGQVRKTVTSGQGVYVFPLMAPGEYTVRAEAAGFKTELRSGLILQLNQKARVDFKLQIGQVSDSVEVSASGVILNTDDAAIGNVVEQKRIVDLPLNGRNFANLAGLVPGVIKGISSNTNQYGRRDTAIAISANGIRENQGQVLYDGVNTAWNINNATFFRASIEAIQEFKVQAATYQAEYGHNAGAQVQVHTRPGTNQLHGALFEFLRNDALDARNYFRPAPLSKDILRRNQFGFVVSGPVFIPKIYNGRDKTFWMVNYEGQRESFESPSRNAVLPIPYRTGNFFAVTTPLRDPLGGFFPGNVIPSNRLDPIAQTYLTIHPNPNVAGPLNYSGVDAQNNNINQVFARGDHNISQSDRLFVRGAAFRYSFPTIPLNYFSPVLSNINAVNGVIGETHTFTTNAINEFRLGFNRNYVLRRNPRTNTDFDPESVGLRGVRSTDTETRQPQRLTRFETGYVPMTVTGYVQMGDGDLIPDFNVTETWHMVDNFTWNRGRHTFKTGFDFRRMRLDRAGSNNARGVFTFNGQVTGDPAADFVLGFPATSQTPDGVIGIQWRQNTYEGFVQDEWKVSRNLTMNLGLRYEYIGVNHEKNGWARSLRLDRPGGYQYPEDPTTHEQIPLYKPEKNRFLPRIGIAYRPSDKWVLRTGFGIFNNANQMNNMSVIGNPNRTFQVQFLADPGDPTALTLQNPYPVGRTAAAAPLSVVHVPTNRVNAYNIQWSASIQRQVSASTFFELAYVGSQASHLDNSRNLNDAPPALGPVQPRRPYPLWGGIRYVASDGKSYYESLQFRAERRLSNGMSFLAGYTWAHNIDQAYGTNESLPYTPGGVQNINCFACERANSGFDYRHRFTFSYLWALPSPKSWHGITALVLKNWSFNGVVTLQSGFPFTVTQAGNRQNTGAATQRPDYVPGQNPELENPDPSRWFNTNAFQFADLHYGNVGRNTLRSPAIKTWDIGLFKEFPVRWRESRFQFRYEAFNLFNTPVFRAPNSQLGAVGYGTITSTWQDNRQLQFALKYLF